MIASTDLIDQLASLHEDAFCWAVACCGGDAEAAADALQEAYVKVVSGRAKFGGKSSLKTWWLGVVRFSALEQQRRVGRWRRLAEHFLDWISDLGPDAPAPAGPAEFLSPPETDWLAAALRQLPARQAEILSLVFQQQLSLREAAVVMRVSVGSARQHYDRAKKKLRGLQPLTASASAEPSPIN